MYNGSALHMACAHTIVAVLDTDRCDTAGCATPIDVVQDFDLAPRRDDCRGPSQRGCLAPRAGQRSPFAADATDLDTSLITPVPSHDAIFSAAPARWRPERCVT